MNNVTNEIAQSTNSINYNNLPDILAPIDEINNNLKYFSNFLRIAHINAVSIPLHRDEIYRVINKTDLDIVGISETNI